MFWGFVLSCFVLLSLTMFSNFFSKEIHAIVLFNLSYYSSHAFVFALQMRPFILEVIIV